MAATGKPSTAIAAAVLLCCRATRGGLTRSAPAAPVAARDTSSRLLDVGAAPPYRGSRPPGSVRESSDRPALSPASVGTCAAG